MVYACPAQNTRDKATAREGIQVATRMERKGKVGLDQAEGAVLNLRMTRALRRKLSISILVRKDRASPSLWDRALTEPNKRSLTKS